MVQLLTRVVQAYRLIYALNGFIAEFELWLQLNAGNHAVNRKILCTPAERVRGKNGNRPTNFLIRSTD